MKRQLTMVAIACLAMGSVLGLAPAMAAAQAAPCFPGGPDYPPAGPEIEVNLSLNDGLLIPTTVDGTLVLHGAKPNLTYCGKLYSAPITAEPTLSSSTGVLTFNHLAIPSDFKLNATHHLDVYRAGQLVGAFDFCVTTTGHLANVGSTTCLASTNANAGTKTPGSLPRTGWDHLVQILKMAAVAIAAGVFFLYLRRRRAAGLSQA